MSSKLALHRSDRTYLVALTLNHRVFHVGVRTTGQNAVHQAEEFNKAAELTGIILTKLDGTAKGGIVIAISAGLGVPVKLVGVGEGIDDLKPFDAMDFAQALI